MPEAPADGDTFYRRYTIGDSVIELLAEVAVEDDTLHLRDIAIYPEGSSRARLGGAAVLATLRSELAAEISGWGYGRLRISGTRLSGAHPGRSVDIVVDVGGSE